MNKPLHLLREETHTSASALKMFLQCPRKFALNYVHKTEPAFRPAALAFGTASHEAVGEHLRVSHDEHVAPLHDLLEVFHASYKSQLAIDDVPVLFDEGETAEQQLELAKNMLATFIEQVELPERVRGIELPFRVAVHDPDTGEELPALVGAIDAVVETSRGLEAWEFKTSARRWASDQIEYDLQPTVVAMGARALRFEEPKPVLIVTTKSKTPAVQVVDLHRGPEDERDVVATVASVERAIAAGVDHPVRGWACRGCQYAHACR